MNALKVLKLERAGIRRWVTNADKKDELERCVLLMKIERLSKLDDEIRSMFMKDDQIKETDVEEEFEGVDHYREICSRLMARQELKVEKEKRLNVRLPKIEWVKFDGQLSGWIQFWGQFSKIHENDDIPAEDKFQYLLQATFGKAKKMVESYPPSEGNYYKVIESMKSRFAKDEVLIDFYVRELLNFVFLCKEKAMKLSNLYDQLCANINNLDSLGVTSDKFEYIIYPLVESCLPLSLLREWERNKNRESVTASNLSLQVNRLSDLMSFLRLEVETEEKVTRTRRGNKIKDDETEEANLHEETAKDLFNNSNNRDICVFCEGKHSSLECGKAQEMSLEDKKRCLVNKRACYLCFGLNHPMKFCKKFVKCVVCRKRHPVLLCDQLELVKDKLGKQELVGNKADSCLPNQSRNEVLLQTLQVKIQIGNKVRQVRCVLDSCSSHSYISSKVAEELSLKSIGEENMVHCLFGGVESKRVRHPVYSIVVQNAAGKFFTNIDVLGQDKICGNIRQLKDKAIIDELKRLGVELTDVGGEEKEIEMLIGADFIPNILTGEIKKIKKGLLAVHTELGWTIMGRSGFNLDRILRKSNALCNTGIEQDFWDLEHLGIKRDEVQSYLKNDDIKLLQIFEDTVAINKEGRYEVCLPWNESKVFLNDNFDVALSRLKRMTKKLEVTGNFEKYEEVFKDWEAQGIIEQVQLERKGHFLPHRPVIKESSLTTKIRPVFDASCMAGKVCLNDCVYKGPNLIELIPSLLLKFRLGAIGVVSDVKQAFLQISLVPEDRQFLKFLWWDSDKQLKCYQHCRVVFGVKPSPFLLGATIAYHLKNEVIDKQVAEVLSKSFYVDNCLVSVENQAELESFIRRANDCMAGAKMELRSWAHTKLEEGHSEQFVLKETCCELKEISVLGMMWNTESDVLKCKIQRKDIDLNQITKRKILSVVQSIFDPVGVSCPITILPKRLLQKCWKEKINWDETLNEEITTLFKNWFLCLSELEKCEVKRYCLSESAVHNECSLHVFVDGSKDAYATCIFVRSQINGNVNVSLLFAKARITPIEEMSIPRIELLAALLGSRVYQMMANEEIFCQMKPYFWSDSSVVLCWLNENRAWKPYVSNRVCEILSITDKECWRHVPGNLNPADLLSRGCSAQELKESNWWLGPTWLLGDEDKWPKSNFAHTMEVYKEEKCTKVNNLLDNANSVTNKSSLADQLGEKFSSYTKCVRIVAYILRFVQKRKDEIYVSAEEFNNSEQFLLTQVQKEGFADKALTKVKNLEIFKDGNLLRVKSRLLLSNDDQNYVYPILLPNDHKIIYNLIMSVHKENKHAGVGVTMVILRERFWVLKCRKTVKKVISNCIVCKKFTAKAVNTPAAPLPRERVQAERVFQNCGVDCFGPLYVKGGKVWGVLFTCAVFRAVHIELVSAMSTECFLLSLRRFIARRGRMNSIICDNGTNFKGACNSLERLDWKRILEDEVCCKINWKFNPPTASWYGGFFERLIRVIKDLLKRNLGKAKLNEEELRTLVCEVENVVNQRPMTYICEEEDLKPLTPAMFLNNILDNHTYDLDQVDNSSLVKRIKMMQRIREGIRTRFYKEYTGLLVSRCVSEKGQHAVKVGDIVLIGSDQVKRFNWPMGRITEIFLGKDGNSRVVKVHTAKGDLIRPLQRIYPLEIGCSNEVSENGFSGVIWTSEENIDNLVEEPQNLNRVTRSGRLIPKYNF